MMVAVLLLVPLGISAAVLIADWTDRSPGKSDADDDKWHCSSDPSTGVGLCTRSTHDCVTFSSGGPFEMCRSQESAACFSFRELLRDEVRTDCFPTMDGCYRRRAASLVDHELGNVGQCDVVNAPSQARRVLLAKIIGGLFGAASIVVAVAALGAWQGGRAYG